MAALAGEINPPRLSSSTVFGAYAGESERRLREAFREARARAAQGGPPAILFIDEIDALCPRRDARPNAIDPALRRPGRFDREIAVTVPTSEERAEILQLHSRQLPLEPSVDLAAIAAECQGYVGADLAALCREAALAALRSASQVPPGATPGTSRAALRNLSDQSAANQEQQRRATAAPASSSGASADTATEMRHRGGGGGGGNAAGAGESAGTFAGGRDGSTDGAVASSAERATGSAGSAGTGAGSRDTLAAEAPPGNHGNDGGGNDAGGYAGAELNRDGNADRCGDQGQESASWRRGSSGEAKGTGAGGGEGRQVATSGSMGGPSTSGDMTASEPAATSSRRQQVAGGPRRVSMQDFRQAMARVGPSVARGAAAEVPSVVWEDVGGLHDVKIPVIAVEADAGLCVQVYMYFSAGAELYSMYVGEGEALLREAFRRARLAAPSIIFFDEADAVASRRSAGERLLATLLTEMDGLEHAPGVLVLGATNRPQALDPALMRPGRFDLVLYVPPPDEEGRLEALQVHTRSMSLAGDVDLPSLATSTGLFTGAELASLCGEAAMAALRESLAMAAVHQRHFLAARAAMRPSLTPLSLQAYASFAENAARRLRVKAA
eukprot:jgi/Mesen1/926/ME000118S00108